MMSRKKSHKNQFRSRKKERLIKIIILAFWLVVLTPLAIKAVYHVRNYYPIFDVEDIKNFFVAHREYVLQDFESLSQDDISVNTNLESETKADANIAINKNGKKELHLSISNAKQGSNVTLSIKVKSFDFAMNSLNIYFNSENYDGFIKISLIEEDGDYWAFNQSVTLNRSEIIRTKIDIFETTLNEIKWWNRGFKNISRIELTFFPNATNYTQKLKIIKITKSDLILTDLAVIPRLNATSNFYRNTYPIEKKNGTYRIVALGDSMLYGVGIQGDVEYADLATTLLENELNAKTQSLKYEVLNFGIPGHNTDLEVDFYQETASKYSPDMIMVFFCNNDGDDMKRMQGIMNVLKEETKYKYLFKTMRGKAERMLKEEALKIMVNEGSLANATLVESSFNRLNNIIEGRIPVVIIALQDTQNEIEMLRKISEEYDWHLIELDWLTEKYGPRRIYIGPDLDPVDNHPSPFGHKRIAEEIFRFLESKKLVP